MVCRKKSQFFLSLNTVSRIQIATLDISQRHIDYSIDDANYKRYCMCLIVHIRTIYHIIDTSSRHVGTLSISVYDTISRGIHEFFRIFVIICNPHYSQFRALAFVSAASHPVPSSRHIRRRRDRPKNRSRCNLGKYDSSKSTETRAN